VVVSSRQTSSVDVHLLSAVRICLFNIFAATLNIWRTTSPFATWGRTMPWWQNPHNCQCPTRFTGPVRRSCPTKKRKLCSDSGHSGARDASELWWVLAESVLAWVWSQAVGFVFLPLAGTWIQQPFFVILFYHVDRRLCSGNWENFCKHSIAANYITVPQEKKVSFPSTLTGHTPQLILNIRNNSVLISCSFSTHGFSLYWYIYADKSTINTSYLLVNKRSWNILRHGFTWR
jgi:hypothetical protein